MDSLEITIDIDKINEWLDMSLEGMDNEEGREVSDAILALLIKRKVSTFTSFWVVSFLGKTIAKHMSRACPFGFSQDDIAMALAVSIVRSLRMENERIVRKEDVN